jgi:hypothetical protein
MSFASPGVSLAARERGARPVNVLKESGRPEGWAGSQAVLPRPLDQLSELVAPMGI